MRLHLGHDLRVGEPAGGLDRDDTIALVRRLSQSLPQLQLRFACQASSAVGAADLDGPSSERHAFYWRADLGMRDLGTLGGTRSTATRINHTSQVIGTSTIGSGVTHGFFWSAATGKLDLGLLIPADLNERGQVVGNAPSALGPSHAFVWSMATGPIDLSTLGGATSGVHG